MTDIGGRRWLVLGLGVAGQAATCVFMYGMAFLLPTLRSTLGLSLAQSGALVAAPAIGLVVTLIAWGAVADRYGERWVMAVGLALAGAFLLAAQFLEGTLALWSVFALAGAAGASVNSASGRVVMGWFPAERRGLAMGARQTAQPLGMGVAALTLPGIARHSGLHAALLLPALLCLATAIAVALLVVDPPRAPRAAGARTGSPYRKPALWRVHGASALLVVPQFVTATFALEYLVREWHWGAVAGGRVLAAVQVTGALGRLAVGRWSDLAGSRLRPMRSIAVTAAAVMLVLAFGDATRSWLAPVALMVGLVVTVTDNGMGFTASAELAGSAWAGRALGAQNTAQNLVAFGTPPLFGALIGGCGYAVAFAIAAVPAAIGAALTPVRSEPTTRPARHRAPGTSLR